MNNIEKRLKRIERILENRNKKDIKKTMIFNKQQLYIIFGLSELKGMQIKDVLYQLLEYSINALDSETKKWCLTAGKIKLERNKK